MKEIYLEPFAVADRIDNTQILDDFIYVEGGHILLLTEEDQPFIIGALHSTTLETNYIGLNHRNDLNGDKLKSTTGAPLLGSFINRKIVSIDLFWNKSYRPAVGRVGDGRTHPAGNAPRTAPALSFGSRPAIAQIHRLVCLSFLAVAPQRGSE